MTYRVLFVLLSLAFTQAVSARSMDINLSNDAAQFKYGTLVGGTTYGRSELTYGLLFNEDDVYLFEVGLLVIDQAGSKSPGLELGIGPKFYFADTDKSDGDAAALGLGGQIRYKNMAAPRIVYNAEGYYAPSIVSFLDADSMFEFNLRLEYEILPTANIYLGYRDIEVEIENSDKNVELDENVVLGVRFKF